MKDQCSLSINLQTWNHHDPLNFASFDHGSSYEGLYVNEEARFAFCAIEKNACSHWTALFNKLETGNLNANGAQYGLIHQKFSAEAASAVFRDQSAIRAVFVRDPLERFLSAFLDKCFDNNCGNGFCFMRPHNMTGQRIPFSRAVEWLKTENVENLDGHFKLQSKHCELDKRIHEYNVVALMKPSTLAKDGSCLLEKAQLGMLNTRGSQEGNVPFWQTPIDVPDPNHVELLKSFYTREAAELVYKIFEKDYETLSIPPPDWMLEAKGEIFHSTRNLKCDVKLPEVSVSKVGQGLEHEEDDLLVLAKRAGYVQ